MPILNTIPTNWWTMDAPPTTASRLCMGEAIADMVKEVRRRQFPMMPRCITMDGMEGKAGIQELSKHMTNTETLAP